jgi:hypothetical protein
MHQHLQHGLVDPESGTLLRGDEAVLRGSDLPQLLARKQLLGHGKNITEPLHY